MLYNRQPGRQTNRRGACTYLPTYLPVSEWGDELVEKSHEGVEEAHPDGEGAEQHEVVPVAQQLPEVVVPELTLATTTTTAAATATTTTAAATSTRRMEVVFRPLLPLVLQLGGLGGRRRRGVSEEGCGQNQRQDAHQHLSKHEFWHPSYAVLAIVIDII